jgi:hypothetical protein
MVLHSLIEDRHGRRVVTTADPREHFAHYFKQLNPEAIIRPITADEARRFEAAAGGVGGAVGSTGSVGGSAGAASPRLAGVEGIESIDQPETVRPMVEAEVFALILHRKGSAHCVVDKFAVPNSGDETLESLHAEADLFNSRSSTDRAVVVGLRFRLPFPQAVPRPVPMIDLGDVAPTGVVSPDFPALDAKYFERYTGNPGGPSRPGRARV